MNQSSAALLDPKYRCCCGQCHITTATKIICYLILSLIIFTIIFAALFRPGHLSTFRIIADLTFASIIVLTLYGVNAERPLWLIPFFVVFGIGIALATFFMFVPLIYLMFYPEEAYRFVPKQNSLGDEIEYTMEEIMDPVPSKIILSRAFLEFIVIALHVWFFFIVFRCFQFLRAKKDAEKLPTNFIPFYTNTAATFVPMDQAFPSQQHQQE